MNAPPAEVAIRRAETDKLSKLMDDFRRAEEPIIQTGTDQFGTLLRDCLPRMQGYAFETGNMKGKIVVEIEYDLTPQRKEIILTAVIMPPPTKLERRSPIRY